MTRSEYQELADFFVARLSRVHEETRTFVQVSVESLRDEVRGVADGVLTNGRHIEENGRRIDALTDRVGQLEDTVSAGFAAQESRIRTLES